MIKTIDIEEAKVYEVAEKLYLYKDGDECVYVTGGWSKEGYTYGTQSNGNATLEDGYINIPATDWRTAVSIIGTVNAINFSGYSTINMEVSQNRTGSGWNIASQKASVSSHAVQSLPSPTAGSHTVVSQPLTANEGYLSIFRGDNTSSTQVFRIWLE